MRVRAYQKERLILPIHTCFQFSSALSLASSFTTSHIFINYLACLFFASCLDTAHSMLMDITGVEMKVFFVFFRIEQQYLTVQQTVDVSCVANSD